MNSNLILVCGVIVLIAGQVACNEEYTTKNIVEKHGYPFEEYTVETEDGYLLGLHRIPHSKNQQSSKRETGPIAFLNHGLLGSSSDWILLGPGKALAYLLSDAGYDVWMGNARGNTYSRRHVKYNPVAPIGPFWDYTFHEIGTMDLPALIDFIRKTTGQDELHYFGHSLGTSSFFVMAALKESYQKYIKSAHMLTPLVYIQDVSKIFLEVSSKIVAISNPLPTLVGGYTEFKLNGTITELLGAVLCDDQPRELCSDVLFIVDGFDENAVDPSIISQVLATTPAGISTKCFLHYFQLHESYKYQRYDYSLLGNLVQYQTATPPVYPLEKVQVPVFLYYGEKDRLIHKEDIDKLSKDIGNMKRSFRIPGGTHQYPMYGVDVKSNLYDLILKDVDSMK